jgi:hypothetical protein
VFQNKTIVNLTFLGIFVSAILAGVAVVRTLKQTEPVLTTSSPNGTYNVRLTGRRDRPKMLFVTNQVFFSVTKNGQEFLTNKYIHSGDWLDPSFDSSYPQHAWVSEDRLRFYREDFFRDGQPETIVVQNKTQKDIQYLRVASVDAFLLFDMQPGTAIKLIVSGPRADNRWITVEGEFSDRQSIKQNEGFVFNKEKKGPFTYHITINSDKTTIDSPELQKYQPR